MDPFHLSGLDADEAWGSALTIRCSCGAQAPLWQARCPSCRTRNRFPVLLKKRKRVERWLIRQIDGQVLPAVRAADLLPARIGQFEQILAEVVRRPIPERQKKEDLAAHLKRVVAFFPSMFKITSPAGLARDIDDRLGRSSRAVAAAALLGLGATHSRILDPGAGPVAQEAAPAVAGALRRDLGELLTPYLESLRILLMYHKRMVSAWAPVRPILQRPPPTGALTGVLNKVRGKLQPVGRLLDFGTAIWQNAGEREQLQRFEAEIQRFLDQTARFREQTADLEQKRHRLEAAWRLSFCRAQIQRLSEDLAAASPVRRAVLVDHVLAQKGIGGFFWRLFFAEKAIRKAVQASSKEA